MSAQEAQAQSMAQVPEAVRPPPGNPRFPLFDGLRAAAALSIVALHSSGATFYSATGLLGPWTNSLDIGVAIFFIISGFLLYRPYVAARLHGARGPRTTTFYRRRILRIVPAYWFALTVLAVTGISRATPTDTLNDWPKYYFFLQSYSPSAGGIGVAWSLCIEVSFYLVLPLYAWVMARFLTGRTMRRQLGVEMAVLLMLSLVSYPFWRGFAHGETVIFLRWLPHYFYWFALGMGLALVSAWASQTGRLGNRVFTAIANHPGALWLAALYLFVVLGLLTEPAPSIVTDTPTTAIIKWLLQPIIALLIVIPAVFTKPGYGLAGKLLSWKPVAWLGLISYGIYLWHLSVQYFIFDHGWVFGPSPAQRTVVSLAMVLGITIPIAAFSYYVIEKPFLRFKDWRPRREEDSPKTGATNPRQ